MCRQEQLEAYFSGALELGDKIIMLCLLETLITLNSSGNTASPAVKTIICTLGERLEDEVSLCTLLEGALTTRL